MDWSEENTTIAVTMWDDKKTAREIGLVLGTTRHAVIGKMHRLGKLRSQEDLLAERQARALRMSEGNTGRIRGTLKAKPVESKPLTESPAAAIIDPAPETVEMPSQTVVETVEVETFFHAEEPVSEPEPGAAAAEPSPGEEVAPEPLAAAPEPEPIAAAPEPEPVATPEPVAAEPAKPRILPRLDQQPLERPEPIRRVLMRPEPKPDPLPPATEFTRSLPVGESYENGEEQRERLHEFTKSTVPRPMRNVDDVTDEGIPFLKAPLQGKCKFPLWSDTSTLPIDQKMVCGKYVPNGKSWCDHHRKMVYEPTRPGRSNAPSVPRGIK